MAPSLREQPVPLKSHQSYTVSYFNNCVATFMGLSPVALLTTWAAPALASLHSPIRPLHSQHNLFICKQHFNLSICASHLQRESAFSQEHIRTMISSRKLAQLAKKWQRMVASSGRQTASIDGCCSTATAYVADKGHCVLYTTDGARFEVPLMYLSTAVFCELLRTSQEEFGFTSDSKITLPCDASVMEYVMCLIRREASEEVERALLSSIVRPCHNTSCVVPPIRLNQHFAVCS